MRRNPERLLIKAMKEQMAGKRSQLPVHLVPIWQAFCDLTRTRRYNDYGPEAITYQEIAAYRDLMGVPLQPHHVKTIMSMDAEWLQQARAVKESGAAPMPKVSNFAVTPEIFDAMIG